MAEYLGSTIVLQTSIKGHYILRVCMSHLPGQKDIISKTEAH